MEEIKKAFQTLSDAIDAMDVGGSISDDDVEEWNEVLKTRNALRCLLEPDAPQG